MRNISLVSICLAAIVTSTSCKKEPTPAGEDLSVLGYSNLRREGDDIHYWSVYTINSDGTNDHKLTGSDMELCGTEWSPDGTQIAFISSGGNASRRSEVYIMNADGTSVKKVTNANGRSNSANRQ